MTDLLIIYNYIINLNKIFILCIRNKKNNDYLK